MTPEETLFLLRLLSALILLAFFGTVGWFMYQDVRLSSRSYLDRERPAGMLHSLEQEGAQVPIQSYQLKPVTTIGRAAHCNIRIDDDFASSQHALIFLRDDHWWIEDQRSRNGTMLNGVPLEKATILASGDVVTIGKTRYELEI